MKKNLIILSSLVILVAVFCFFYKYNYKKDDFKNDSSKNINLEIKNFDDCLKSGNPVMESYPRQCRAIDGSVFVENIGNELEKKDLIMVNNPRPKMAIESPLEISGEARGYWYFEASFPVEIINSKGEIISTAIATAQSDWMTEGFVPFSSKLEFNQQEAGSDGKIIFKKDNPSGLPENDDFLEMPIIFK